MSRIAVIGGGAAGMAAAIAAADGQEVELFEQNEKLGKKIYITGKGRCNLTNACDMEEFFQAVVKNPKFLYSALYGFDNQQVIDFFNQNGCQTKVERGNRVFPVSDHSSDVIRSMEQVLKQKKVKIHLHSKVQEIMIHNGHVIGIMVNQEKKNFDAVIIATGGFSYQSTGSTGDGYGFAKKIGHTIQNVTPALVPMETEESYIPLLQGVSLKNVKVTIFDQKKKLYEEFGEMLFTHFGVSGPLMLSASSVVNGHLAKHSLQAYIDLKPAITMEQLDRRVLKEFQENQNKDFRNAIHSLFPTKLIPVMISLSGIDPYKKVNEITKEERDSFCKTIKYFPLTLSRTRDFNEAIITRGGVTTKEIDPSTMESKLVKGIYFAGELIDVDALTGGYNLQIAWSTGVLAGRSARLEDSWDTI